MREFDQRNKTRRTRRLFYSSPMLFLMVIILGVGMVKVYGIAQKADNTRNSLSEVSQNYERLKVRDNYLQSSIAALKTQEGIEAKIREEYGYVKEGEEMVMVINNKTLPPQEDEEVLGFWESLLPW